LYLRAFLQGTISFFVILFLARLTGKQQIAQLTFLDYVLAITVGSIASSMTIIKIETFGPSLAGLLTWFFWSLVIGFISLKSRIMSKLFHGKPTIVIQNGKILEQNIGKLPNYKIEDLRSQLRDKSVFSLGDVEYAILETSGELSVQKKAEKQTVTREDMNLNPDYAGLPRRIIFQGKIIEKNLKGIDLTEEQLYQKLKKLGISNIKEVMYGAIDPQGKLFIDKFDDETDNIKVF